METLAAEMTGHVSRRCCSVSASIAVGTAWLLLVARPVRAEPATENARSAAPAAGGVPAAAPSVLLLPPRLPPQAAEAALAEADAACDRLAQDLAAAGLARVVDRTQLERILQERRLQAEPARPMLSYDAMIRLEADTTRLAPETTLSLIDLSNGNIIAQRSFAWPPKEDDAKAMLDFCRDALKKITKPAAGKLRVRTLWAAEATPNVRMTALGKRLIEIFEQSLDRSERVVLVRHLEAATAKEESLLLLLGLSRLPGGRQFTPQADAAIELPRRRGRRPRQDISRDTRGNRRALRKGSGYEGNWVTTAGLVRDFDTLIQQAWRKLAQALGEVRPETATTLLSEMSRRRTQADAELQLVREMRKSPSTGPRQGAKILLVALPHAETALKLDPTYPEAARVYVELLASMSLCDYEKRLMPEAPLRTLREAACYVDRFRQNAELCGSLCENGVYGLVRSPLDVLYHQSPDEPLRPFTSGRLTLTPELVEALDAAKRLLERGVDDDVSFRYYMAEGMLVATFRGMRFTNMPAAQRQAWLKMIAGRCLEKVKRGKARYGDPRTLVFDWQECTHLQVPVTAELLVEDGQPDAASRILARAQSDIPRVYVSGAYSLLNLMRAKVRNAHDAPLWAEFNRWLQHGQQAKVRQLDIAWPPLDIFARKRTPIPPRPAPPSRRQNPSSSASPSAPAIVRWPRATAASTSSRRRRCKSPVSRWATTVNRSAGPCPARRGRCSIACGITSRTFLSRGGRARPR